MLSYGGVCIIVRLDFRFWRSAFLVFIVVLLAFFLHGEEAGGGGAAGFGLALLFLLGSGAGRFRRWR